MKNTIENNKLIAEFMEIHEIMLDDYSNYEIDVIYPILGIKPNHHKGLIIHESDLQFHSSWDWLMPVVEKYYEVLDTIDVEHEDEFRIKLHEQLLDVNLEGLYEVVVNFIKWYNEQN
jgi:hypothetical protein